mmetsp:Transcript_24683/g.36659  ORF Transcript_24683/g.36659 Transcript_24683/m.36659 type:complete len:81 (-) Transcript_24683:1127-1369(-)
MAFLTSALSYAPEDMVVLMKKRSSSLALVNASDGVPGGKYAFIEPTIERQIVGTAWLIGIVQGDCLFGVSYMLASTATIC